MNVVFIMTDTQNRSMVGSYGLAQVDTPSLDRLAASGVRFDRAYTTCPLCTPARSAIFSGLHSQVNGAYCNNVAPHANIALAGTIVRKHGKRAAYTGKWHLDGSAYFGDGEPGGGFEADWWYDGKRYAEDVGEEMFRAYRSVTTARGLRSAGFSEKSIWGHRVADRAIDFLEHAGDDDFFLAVSFDEPHGPYIAPPEFWEGVSGVEIPEPANYFASIEGKPELQRIQRGETMERLGGVVPPWQEYAASYARWIGCNNYIDREIGRVLDAVDRLYGDDTVVIYTADHGEQFGSHGLEGKGPMMYEESCNIPFVVRVPGGPSGIVSDALVSHIDVLPTVLDFMGIDRPELLHGVSLRSVLNQSESEARDCALISFHRFAINHDSFGEFYPIRCATDGRFKLIINLFDTDEFYDLHDDPAEVHNRIGDPTFAIDRERLHDWLLSEMDRIRDPYRSFRWGDRSWRSARRAFYHSGNHRRPPRGFEFQPRSIDT